jgi:DNA-binding response OmpR family regulator
MRVLVVEDERKVAGFVRRGLEAEGYAVDAVHDGDTALARAVPEQGSIAAAECSSTRALRLRGLVTTPAWV